MKTKITRTKRGIILLITALLILAVGVLVSLITGEMLCGCAVVVLGMFVYQGIRKYLFRHEYINTIQK